MPTTDKYRERAQFCYLSPELRRDLRELAKRRQLSVSAVMRELLSRAIDCECRRLREGEGHRRDATDSISNTEINDGHSATCKQRKERVHYASREERV